MLIFIDVRKKNTKPLGRTVTYWKTMLQILRIFWTLVCPLRVKTFEVLKKFQSWGYNLRFCVHYGLPCTYRNSLAVTLQLIRVTVYIKHNLILTLYFTERNTKQKVIPPDTSVTVYIYDTSSSLRFIFISWPRQYFYNDSNYYVICSIGIINDMFCIPLQRVSDKNIATECQNRFDYNFNFRIVVYKLYFSERNAKQKHPKISHCLNNCTCI